MSESKPAQPRNLRGRTASAIRCFPLGVGFGLRIPVFGLAFLLLLCPGLGLAQPKNPAPPPVLLAPAEGERQARELLAHLLAQKPAQSSSNIAVVKVRGSDRKETQIPAGFAVLVTPTNYLNIYEAGAPGAGSGRMKLTIIHSDDRPNEYLLSEAVAKGETEAQPRRLTHSQLMMPFAGSDFWVADLGLEFLHWPQQRVLKREMRRGQSCAVLESLNPHPVPGGYSRVVSWVGTSHPDEFVLVHADAYDSQERLLKEFDPKSLEKVNGAYQLESMEMRNVQTSSRTVIEFDLGAP